MPGSFCKNFVFAAPAGPHTDGVEQSRYSTGEIVKRGEAIYARDIKPVVEPDHVGEFVVIDIETGEYDLDRRDIDAALRMRNRRPNAALYIGRVGYEAAYSFGGLMKRTQ